MKRFLVGLVIALLAFVLGIAVVRYVNRCGLSFRCAAPAGGGGAPQPARRPAGA